MLIVSGGALGFCCVKDRYSLYLSILNREKTMTAETQEELAAQLEAQKILEVTTLPLLPLSLYICLFVYFTWLICTGISASFYSSLLVLCHVSDLSLGPICSSVFVRSDLIMYLLPHFVCIYVGLQLIYDWTHFFIK